MSKGPEPVVIGNIEVTLSSVNGDTDRMIRKFIRMVKTDGILRESFLRRHYKKPSVARRDKSAKARSRVNCEERKVKK